MCCSDYRIETLAFTVPCRTSLEKNGVHRSLMASFLAAAALLLPAPNNAHVKIVAAFLQGEASHYFPR